MRMPIAGTSLATTNGTGSLPASNATTMAEQWKGEANTPVGRPLQRPNIVRVRLRLPDANTLEPTSHFKAGDTYNTRLTHNNIYGKTSTWTCRPERLQARRPLWTGVGWEEQGGRNSGPQMPQRPLIRLAQQSIDAPYSQRGSRKVCMVCPSQNNGRIHRVTSPLAYEETPSV